jgi:hypothetical protein
MYRATLLGLALVVPLAASVRAGTVSIAPSTTTATVGETVTLTVSINSMPRNNPPGDELTFIATDLSAGFDGGPIPVTVGNFRVDPALPSGSSFITTFPRRGAARVQLPEGNGLLSYQGPIYEFELTPPVAGEYFFEINTGTGNAAHYVDMFDSLEPGATAFAEVSVRPSVVPEPTGLALALVCLGGLALRVWRTGS